MTAEETLLLNIIGGIIAAFVYSIILIIKKYIRKRRIKYLLGTDVDRDSEFNLAYAKLALPPVHDDKNNPVLYPYYKPRIRQNKPVRFSVANPVSSCEVRGLKYLTSSLLSRFSGNSKLVADVDECIGDTLNISFISLGGPYSNYKTGDLLSNESNIFLQMDSDNFITIDGKPIIKIFQDDHDYGIIVRIRPVEFPKRVWIACAGLGEWGTSGSAWFLSHKYSELLKKIKHPVNLFAIGKGKDFAAIVKVKNGQDESAKLLGFFESKSDLEDFIKDQEELSKTAAPNSGLSYPGLTNYPTGSVPPSITPSGIGSIAPYMDSTSGSYIYIAPIHTQSLNEIDSNENPKKA